MTTQKLCPQFSLLRLTGSDTLTFVNNQTINNFDDQVAIPHYSAICNAKGRILFSLLIWPIEEGVIMAVDHSLAENLLNYINMRRFRMQLNCIHETTLSVACYQPAGQTLSAFTLTEETPQSKLADNDFWQLFFKAQLPWITGPTSALFIPQHLSLDAHNLIEYQKGCYPGQEVIARLHFLGKIKKQLSVEDINTREAHQIGETVTLYDGSQGQICSPVIVIDGAQKAQVVKGVNLF